MKLLMVTHKFPPAIGGMEVQCHELYNGLLQLGVPVSLVKFDGKSSRLWWLLRLAGRVRRELRADRSITHVYFNDALCALAGARGAGGVVRAATVHGLDAVFPNRIYQLLVRRLFAAQLDIIIAVSEATGSECVKRGAPAARVVVIPNGVDGSIVQIAAGSDRRAGLIERLGIPREKAVIITSIGRGVVRKGFSWFIRNVMPRLPDNYVYLLIGPPDRNVRRVRFLSHFLPREWIRQIGLMGIAMDRPNIDEARRDPRVQNRVFDLGRVGYEELVGILRASDFFAMPNLSVPGDAEGFGLVALEAVLAGTTVVAADIDGIPEAIQHERNGFLIPSGDAGLWAKTITSLTGRRSFRTTFSTKAVRYSLERFSWKRMAVSYRQALESIKREVR